MTSAAQALTHGAQHANQVCSPGERKHRDRQKRTQTGGCGEGEGRGGPFTAGRSSVETWEPGSWRETVQLVSRPPNPQPLRAPYISPYMNSLV